MLVLFLLTICAITITIFYKSIMFFYHDYNTRKKFSCFPEFVSYPIIGTLSLISQKNYMQWSLSLLNKITNGIFLIWMGSRPIISLSKPELIQIILSSTVNVEKGEIYDFYKQWLGNGLVTSPKKRWKNDRKLLLPTFHFDILEQMAGIMSEKTEDMIRNLEKEIAKNVEKAIDIISIMDDLTFNIICETIIGINASSGNANARYIANIQKLLKLIIKRQHKPWLWKDWVYYLTSDGKKFKAVLHDLHKFTDSVIQKKKLERKMRINESGNDENDSDKTVITERKRKNFLDILIDLNEKENNPLTDEDLRSQVDTFIFAGQDTTASTLIWALFSLGNNLEHQEKVHEELETVFKESQDPATVKQLSELKFLERVIKETLRLYPSIPIIMRKISEDLKMDDYAIPKDTWISLPIILVHRNPKYWPDPQKFDPDRFLPENMKKMNPYAYIPFSAGPRNCIGQKYSMLEIKTVLTAVLRKWRVGNVETPTEITFANKHILRPSQDSIYLRFTPKK